MFAAANEETFGSMSLDGLQCSPFAVSRVEGRRRATYLAFRGRDLGSPQQ
jgi:hypothetical protein